MLRVSHRCSVVKSPVTVLTSQSADRATVGQKKLRMTVGPQIVRYINHVTMGRINGNNKKIIRQIYVICKSVKHLLHVLFVFWSKGIDITLRQSYCS